MGEKRITDLAKALREASASGIISALHAITKKFAAQAEYYAKGFATTKLNVRTGRLRSSLSGRPLLINRRTFAIELSSNVEYAASHEFGATITPKRSKFLAIPVKDELKTKSGVDRYPSPRLVPGLTYAQSMKGQPLLVNQMTGDVWYVLRKRVVIPERPFMRPAIRRARKNISPALSKALGGTVVL